MKISGLFTISFFIISNSILSQIDNLPTDTSITTSHSIMVNGKKVSYYAESGMQPVWGKDDSIIASLHYTYYSRNDINNPQYRPLLISFNGGPGSASVWMHIAYTGPKILNIDNEGYPIQPYGIKDNNFSVLDVADILYVNPVNTGYSRATVDIKKKNNRDLFFGINSDIEYLAAWLTTFVSRKNKWLSPKFLIGESYGGTRVSGLASKLQEKEWMYLNGVILVSPADYNFFESDPPISSALNLPYYAATAWYFKKLSPELQSKDLLDILPEIEHFTVNKLMPSITYGGSLTNDDKEKVAQEYSKYSGISKKSILQYNLNVPKDFFWKELLRDENGNTIGRLDSRYKGIDKIEAGSSPDHNIELSSWLHSFTPAINYYLREILNFKTDVKYNMFGDVHPWDTKNNNTREELRSAMAQNPFLNIMVQSGYFDGATTYFNAKYTMWQLDPSSKLSERMIFKGYRSGHMMYLRKEDLKTANDDLREFILKSINNGKPAKYD